MMRRLYDWTMAWSAHPRALWALGVISFIESSIFPIPPDVLIVAMVLARRESAWAVAAVASVTSVLGGLAGYAIGYFLFESVGAPILDFYGYLAEFDAFAALYNEWGAWIVAGAGLTPFPYKAVTILSGTTQLNLVVFTIASALSRSARFFLVAALLWRFGPPIRRFIERYFGILTVVFFVLLIGGFVALRFLF